MAKPKVFIVRASAAYINIFRMAGFVIAIGPHDADLVVFTGGEDVTPAMYGDAAHPKTYNTPSRDEFEKRIFQHCVEDKIPMVGICRGGQFLNVMNGGKMYQDVGMHCGSHNITDVSTGEHIYVSSTHHQMMRPSDEAILIAYSNLGGFKEYMKDGFKVRVEDDEPDVEVLFYPVTECLCFQPHPEFHMQKGDSFEPMYNYFFSLIEEHLKLKWE